MPSDAYYGLLRSRPAKYSTDYPDDDPHGAMQLAFEQLKSEYPVETSVAKLSPMSGPMKWLLAAPVAATFPTHGIQYNPDEVSRNQATNADILAHELTHVKQNMARGLKRFLIPDFEKFTTSYLEQPHEVEAFNASRKRAARRRDIPLPEK